MIFRPSVGPPPAPNRNGFIWIGGPIVTRCDTRSGRSTASRSDVWPPIELPTKAALSMPKASSSWVAASTWSSVAKSAASESPQPGMSGAITRKFRASASMFGE
ncbi:hypothetical protein ATK30_8187 [Amycolatopsis echigonensis]|uniref:Uncharacterized protein n=1 Tax=Amycolatopsis echigonensis TaxID=2576905 RepID=A0A2N3WTL7_9PSEU|nr:hypothetical protein ATK30_8187 [Amycolatopsis niigatensis]